MPANSSGGAAANEELARMAKEVAYTAIGLGVMGFQKAQVRRHEVLKTLDQSLGVLFERLDAGIEPVARSLPAPAQSVLKQAKATRDQLRGYLAAAA